MKGDDTLLAARWILGYEIGAKQMPKNGNTEKLIYTLHIK
jgi:hypothetical protein